MIGWRRWAHLGAILAALVVAYFVIPVEADVQRNAVLRGLAVLLIGAMLVAGIVRQLRLHLDDTNRRVDGLIVSITAVIIVFSYCFFMIEQRDPDQFAQMHTRLDALYFSAATAATVGYGDVHAVGQTARGLVLVQMTFNVVFIGTAVALLSSRIKAVSSARSEARATEHKQG
jgi:voltage-gated potassium channel